MPDESSELQRKIAEARQKDPADSGGTGRRSPASGYGMAIRMAVELVAALGVSVFLGLWIDGELNTAPLFLIIFLIMGMGAGFINVVRAASGFTRGSLRDPVNSKEDRTRGD